MGLLELVPRQPDCQKEPHGAYAHAHTHTHLLTSDLSLHKIQQKKDKQPNVEIGPDIGHQ